LIFLAGSPSPHRQSLVEELLFSVIAQPVAAPRTLPQAGIHDGRFLAMAVLTAFYVLRPRRRCCFLFTARPSPPISPVASERTAQPFDRHSRETYKAHAFSRFNAMNLEEALFCPSSWKESFLIFCFLQLKHLSFDKAATSLRFYPIMPYRFLISLLGTSSGSTPKRVARFHI